MNIDEAKTECQRWLDYLKRQEEKSLALQKLAADRRAGRCDEKEMRRRMGDINGPTVTVYDGARLAEAVRVLMDKAS